MTSEEWEWDGSPTPTEEIEKIKKVLLETQELNGVAMEYAHMDLIQQVAEFIFRMDMEALFPDPFEYKIATGWLYLFALDQDIQRKAPK